MVIENKIGAPEQPEQLQRYYAWLQQQHEYRNRALVYLTLDGRKSLTAGNNPYFCLSYGEDIAGWLQAALSGVKAIRVREVLGQYLEVVRTL